MPVIIPEGAAVGMVADMAVDMEAGDERFGA
jgi:hypothetical protein